MALTIQELKHDIIDPDPSNPRQVFDEAKLRELGEDIAVRGMLQPMMVRPHPKAKGRHLIVFGERRWRAAALIGLATVPVIVREMNDLDALEAQVAENDKRTDIHPLEEADAYRRLHEDHGRDVDEIAALCGKSTGYIYAAMKLCALSAEPRKAFLAGKLDKSRALLIARLPMSQQARATDEISDRAADDPTSYRDAANHIRRNYMLRLAEAPFKVGDGLLVEKAGPCTTCPKRTGNQQELFADVCGERGGDNICTDSICYRSKVDAHWQRVKNEAEARGQEVIEGKAAQNAGGYGDKKLLDLDRTAHDLGEYDKTYRQLLGKSAADAVAVVARGETGEIKELISRSDLPKLMKEAGVKAPKKENGHGGETHDYSERNKIEKLTTEAIHEAVLCKYDDASAMDQLRLLARMVIRVCRNDAHRSVLAKNDLKTSKDYSARATLLAFAGELDTQYKVRNLAVELLLAETRGWLDEAARGLDRDDEGDAIERAELASNLEDAAVTLGIDVPAIVKKVKADLAAAAKEKKDGKKKTADPVADAAAFVDKAKGKKSAAEAAS